MSCLSKATGSQGVNNPKMKAKARVVYMKKATCNDRLDS